MFTNDYKKARKIFADNKLMAKLPSGAEIPDLKNVFGSAGPTREYAGRLDALRQGITSSVRQKNMSEGQVIVAGCEDASSRGMMSKLRSSDASEKCAAAKMARHLYLSKTRGGQEVWVYAGPREYSQNVFSELKGKTGQALASKLDAHDEVYSASQRENLSELVQVALSWCMKANTKLGAPDADTLKIIQFWFGTDVMSDKQLKRLASKLNGGFKKMTTVFNSNKLIFADDAADRVRLKDSDDASKGTGWDDFAFVMPSEKLEVVYVQNAMLKSISTKKWLAVLTLIHEVSHRKLKTDDVRYDYEHQLSPSEGEISAKKALKNADTWGYFCADLFGALPASVKQSVGKT